MPPGVPSHVVREADGTPLTMDLDIFGGIRVLEADGTVLSLDLLEA